MFSFRKKLKFKTNADQAFPLECFAGAFTVTSNASQLTVRNKKDTRRGQNHEQLERTIRNFGSI